MSAAFVAASLSVATVRARWPRFGSSRVEPRRQLLRVSSAAPFFVVLVKLVRADGGVELVRIDRVCRIAVARESDLELRAAGVEEARAKAPGIAQHTGVVVGFRPRSYIRAKGVIELDSFAVDYFVHREARGAPLYARDA